METTNANLNVNVSNIKVGDKIFLRSNCHYNTNVETGETAYLICNKAKTIYNNGISCHLP